MYTRATSLKKKTLRTILLSDLYQMRLKALFDEAHCIKMGEEQNEIVSNILFVNQML